VLLFQRRDLLLLVLQNHIFRFQRVTQLLNLGERLSKFFTELLLFVLMLLLRVFGLLVQFLDFFFLLLHRVLRRSQLLLSFFEEALSLRQHRFRLFQLMFKVLPFHLQLQLFFSQTPLELTKLSRCLFHLALFKVQPCHFFLDFCTHFS
jgi:hypothetical protein